LITAAGSARRIFLRKAIVQGRSRSEAWHRQKIFLVFLKARSLRSLTSSNVCWSFTLWRILSLVSEMKQVVTTEWAEVRERSLDFEGSSRDQAPVTPLIFTKLKFSIIDANVGYGGRGELRGGVMLVVVEDRQVLEKWQSLT